MVVSIRGRMMPSRKKDAMNTAIAITQIKAPNHIPIRDANLRRCVADFETSSGDAEYSDSIESTLLVEIFACDCHRLI